MDDFELDVLGRRGQPHAVPGAHVVPLYPAATGGSRFAPPLWDNAKALAYVAAEWRADLHHYVFAPNPRSSAAIVALRRWRKKPCVQTIASPPKDFTNIDALLFGDVVVAQSEWTRSQLERHSTRAGALKVEVIAPPLAPLSAPTSEQQRELRGQLGISGRAAVLVYPGDLEFSQGAERVAALAKALPAGVGGTQAELTVVFACRRKTERAAQVEQRLKRELAGHRVVFTGELPSLLPLLSTASAVLFPVEELFGKVDVPITLLEAAQLGTPVLVADAGPAAELVGARRLPAGDTGQWLRCVAELVEGEALRNQVIAEQRAGIAQRHSAEVVATQYQRIYRRLLAR